MKAFGTSISAQRTFFSTKKAPMPRFQLPLAIVLIVSTGISLLTFYLTRTKEEGNIHLPTALMGEQDEQDASDVTYSILTGSGGSHLKYFRSSRHWMSWESELMLNVSRRGRKIGPYLRQSPYSGWHACPIFQLLILDYHTMLRSRNMKRC